MLVGAPGTGKSTFGKRLQQALGAELVETDRVRKQLFTEPRYNGGESAAVYGWCHNLLRTLLRAGRTAIFDATNLEERHRWRLYQLAEETSARLHVVWLTAPRRVVQERLLRRHQERDVDDLSDADWRVHLELRRRADPIRCPHVIVNSATDIGQAVRRVAGQVLPTAGDLGTPPPPPSKGVAAPRARAALAASFG